MTGLRDSKELSEPAREALAEEIRARAEAWCVASLDAFLIDRINIYQASCVAMRRAIAGLDPPPDYLLLDAVRLGDVPLPQEGIIHGDARCQAIAAASILAKVARDRCMREWDAVYPQYGLRRHKGYTTAEHLHALAEWGPTPHHRFSFEPVREACPQPLRRDPAAFPWSPAPSAEAGLVACPAHPAPPPDPAVPLGGPRRRAFRARSAGWA